MRRSESNGTVLRIRTWRFVKALQITVCYVGKLKKNGGVVDSCDGDPPSKFRLGRRKVIEGLDAGIDGMRVGGRRRLLIPPSMAYGSGGGKDIPPNSWLIYDVELVKVH